jgi:hypothetical protein
VQIGLQKVDKEAIKISYNWNSYPNLELHFSLLRILDAYGLNISQRMRIDSFANSAINDAMVTTWM